MASRASPYEHTTSTLQGLEEKISDQVQCAICCEDYEQPKSLPCAHVFCLHCLEQLVATLRSEDENAGSLECPQCRKMAEIPEGGVAGLPTAFLINTMLEFRSDVQSVQQEFISEAVSSTRPPSLRFRGNFVRAITDLYRPWGLSVNRCGELVVIDNTGWYGVHIFKKDGTRCGEGFLDSVAWSPWTPFYGVGDGQCYEPRGVAIDGSDNILVVDGKAHRIQLLTSTGSFVTSVGTWGKAPLQFDDPVGIAVNRTTSEIYVCDRRNNRIQVLTADLSFQCLFGCSGVGPGTLHYPWDVDIDSAGNVFVADCGHSCIKVFTPLGRYLRSIGCGKFEYLTSICIDKDDFIYAADKDKNCVLVFSPQGDFVRQFGKPGFRDGQLSEPMGVAVDDDGLVYVSDSYNGRVQIFQ